jgi:tetratricopeptide (TPR) repeat protein
MNDLYRLLDQAIKLHGSGKLAEAERIYTALLSAEPANFTALHFLGILRAQQGRNDEALSLIGAAIRCNPRSASAPTNQGTVLAALNRHQEALASYDRSLALQPDADTLNNRAIALQALSRFQEAVFAYDGVLAAKPDHAQAWSNRGNALQELRRYPEALASFDRALKSKREDVQIWTNRSITLWSMGDFREALSSADRALSINPAWAAAWSHRGNVLRALDRPEDSLESFDRAIALDGNDADAHLNKSYCLLSMGRWQEGWRLFEWRKRLPAPVGLRRYAQPPWTGKEALGGKTLFCYAEQGLGDTVQFFRYCALAQARGARVILAPQNGLIRLLKNADPAVELIPQEAVPQHFDYHIPLMSLPLAFNTTVETVPENGPYLAPDPSKARQARASMGEHGFRIGIAWRGDERGMMRGKSFSPALLEKLAKLPGVRLISLQRDITEEEKQSILPALNVETLGQEFDQGPDAFIDTAAAMHNLDLVISSDTAVAHIAGAMGIKTWIALKRLPDWRWLLNRTDTPWYRTVTLYRQESEGDWASVFEQMQSQLGALLRS